MKKCILLFLLAAIVQVHGQSVIITPPVIEGPLVKIESVWNITVINNSQTPFNGRIQVTLTDQSGRAFLSATSNSILFTKGVKILNYATVSPISYNYNAVTAKDNYLKVGLYNLCYSIIQEKDREAQAVGEECVDVNIEPVTPPLLVFPPDMDTIYENHPMFNWVAPAPVQLFNSLRYGIKVVEVFQGQSTLQALEYNNPVYLENNLFGTGRNLPNSTKGLIENKNYAWQVFAYDGPSIIKSEGWQFHVLKDSVLQIIENSPYITMKLNRPEFGMMHQGYVKVAFNNYSTDTVAKMKIIEEGGESGISAAEITIPIKAGENYVLEALDKNVRLDENKFYQLVWMNSRGEKWIVRYKPKYYNK